MSLAPKNMGSPRRKSDFPCFCLKFKLHPQGIPHFFSVPLKKSSSSNEFYNLPLKNFIAPQPGGEGGASIKIMYAIAETPVVSRINGPNLVLWHI